MIELIKKLLPFLKAALPSVKALFKKSNLSESDYQTLLNWCRKEYNQKKGLVKEVKESVEMARTIPGLMKEKLLQRFLNMNPKETASNLCNTVCRYLWLVMKNGSKKLSFQDFYIKGVNDGYIKFKNRSARNAVWMADELGLMATWMIINYHEFKRSKKYKPEQIYNDLLKTDRWLVLVRNDKHTYLAGKYKEEWICFDTYHMKWNGKKLNNRIKAEGCKYIYWY
jgi:hypothetical protein